MMSPSYILRLCKRCGIMTDHTRFSYLNETVYCCLVCQNDEVINTMEKTYTVVSIHDPDHNSPKRRTVVVEIQRKSVPDKLGETETKIEYFKVQYSAYGPDHYTAAAGYYPGNGLINHLEASAIASEIRKIVIKDKKS